MRKSRKGRKRAPAAPVQKPADPRLQQAINAIRAKNYDAANAALQQVLQDAPGDANAHNLMGVALIEQGRASDAATHLNQATRAQPGNPFFAFNLGRAFMQAGKLDQAVDALQQATRLKPDLATAHAMRGDALRAMQQWSPARGAYMEAIKHQDNQAQAHHGLGLVLMHLGDHGPASQHFREALSNTPVEARRIRATIHANLGLCLDQTGKKPEAVSQLLEAVNAAPDNAGFRQALVTSLKNIRDVPEPDKLRPVLLALLERDDVNPRSLDTAVQACIRQLEGVSDLLADLDRDPECPGSELAPYSTAVKALLADGLFQGLLGNAPVTDVGLEILVTRLRRTLLEAHIDPASTANSLLADWTDDRLGLAATLAQQGWLNEYVALITPFERDAVQKLGDRLLSHGHVSEETDWQTLAVIACYGPLADTGIEVTADEAPPQLKEVIKSHIDELNEEAAIRSSLATLKPMQDQVSLAVQEQYEQNPYPRWTRFNIREPKPLLEVVQADLPYISASDCPETDSPRVLIAGCGTGLQTMKAVCQYRGASILGIDLSRASLAYGVRKLREYGIDTVEHLHADILDLEQLEEQFDIVESYGVIHHMDDTENALRILANRLKPGGIMYLGLYSEIGRQSIVEVRDLIARRGYSQDDEGIRQVRRDIMRELDPELEPLLSPASDFWTMSDVRDLIFHVQEHRFTLLQIGDMIEACGLTFLGLALRNPADRLAFDREFADKDAARDINNWHSFEVSHPETFGDTYKIWLKKG